MQIRNVEMRRIIIELRHSAASQRHAADDNVSDNTHRENPAEAVDHDTANPDRIK